MVLELGTDFHVTCGRMDRDDPEGPFQPQTFWGSMTLCRCCTVELGEGPWPGHSEPAVGKDGAGTHGLSEEQ